MKDRFLRLMEMTKFAWVFFLIVVIGLWVSTIMYGCQERLGG